MNMSCPIVRHSNISEFNLYEHIQCTIVFVYSIIIMCDSLIFEDCIQCYNLHVLYEERKPDTAPASKKKPQNTRSNAKVGINISGS